MPTFEGFERPEENWFKMPRSWPKITVKMKSLAELKVVEYVLCHTWGFGEFGKSKRFTVDEFMHGRKRKTGSRMDEGTGLSERGVQEGLKKAVAEGYLIEEIDDTDKGRIKRYFSLRMRDDESEGQNLPPSGVQESRPRGIRTNPRSEKEPLETNYHSNSSKKEPCLDLSTIPPAARKFLRGKFSQNVQH
jgi:hypothetical protein